MRSGLTSLAPALVLLALSGEALAEPRSIDRLVARVDGSAILLSDLMRAARPRISPRGGQPAWQRAAALRLALGEAREEAIVSALFEAHARRLELGVSDSEVEAALVRIAADQRMSVEELLARAHTAGLSPVAYRTELRRQVLEQRLLMREPHGTAGRPPRESGALGRWLVKRRALLVAELGRRACIERYGRF